MPRSRIERSYGSSFLLYLLRLALCSKIRSSVEKVLWTAEKNMYSVSGVIFYRNFFCPFDLKHCLILNFLVDFFFFSGWRLCWYKKFIEVTHCCCIGSICVLTSSSFSLWILIPDICYINCYNCIFPCWIVTFISVKWFSLSLLTDFALKSPLLGMNIAISGCFW
jgi:hypothetical protein